MEKVILYGLGKFFQKYYQHIFSQYEVVGLSDREEGKVFAVLHAYPNHLFNTRAIKVHELKKEAENCDYILITAGNYGVLAKYLIKSLGIKATKIKAYQFDTVGCMHFYGEHNEDAVICLLLIKYGIKPEEVTYLDIGSNNPINCNNSYCLYRLGASGCLIDPLEEFQYASMVTRHRDSFIRAAVSDKTEESPKFFFVCENSALSSLYDDHRKRWDGLTANGLRQRLEVKVIGVNDVLRDMEKKPQVVFIDAEGEDIKIAEAIDYDLYEPRIVCVEVCGYAMSVVEGLVAFMEAKGYQLYADIKGVNYVFVKI